VKERIKCAIGVCRRSCRNDGRFKAYICGRCLKTADAALRAEWKRRRQAHRAFLRQWQAKTRPSPYATWRANARACMALWIAANHGFMRCVQDARIKRAMGL